MEQKEKEIKQLKKERSIIRKACIIIAFMVLAVAAISVHIHGEFETELGVLAFVVLGVEVLMLKVSSEYDDKIESISKKLGKN